MIYLAFIILLCLLFLGWTVSKDLFAPFVIVPAVWCFILFLYFFLAHDLYPLVYRFPSMLILWSVFFSIASVFVYSKTASASLESTQRRPNQTVIDCYTLITVILVPIISIVTVVTAIMNNPANIFLYIRMMNTGLDDSIETPDFGILNYFVSLAFIVLLFLLQYSKNKKLITLIIFLNFMLGIVTMAKMTFLTVIFSSLYVLYLRKVVKIRHLIYGLCGFVVLSLVLQSIRGASSSDNVEMVNSSDFFVMYLLTSMSAFEYFVEPSSSYYMGENTFRFFYAIANFLGLEREALGTILEFVRVPLETNTYTILYPFYKDFGVWGVGVFSLVYGATFGFLYKKAITGSSVYVMIYTLFLNAIVLQFIGEVIIVNMSLYIQQIFFIVLPFVINNYGKNRYIDGHV